MPLIDLQRELARRFRKRDLKRRRRRLAKAKRQIARAIESQRQGGLTFAERFAATRPPYIVERLKQG